VSIDIQDLALRLADLESRGTSARSSGEEGEAERLLREGLQTGLGALEVSWTDATPEARHEVTTIVVRLALHCGEVAVARDILDRANGLDSLEGFREMDSWPDAWLVAAARREPPEMDALNTLVSRHWKRLFATCRLLTLDREAAADLAQQTWCRVLRARRELRPGGNFPAYVKATATNLWRDARRSTRRAGDLASNRLVSLSAPVSGDGEGGIIADIVPDDHARHTDAALLRALDVDEALKQLPPHLHDVLVSRYVLGESCASIGSRYDRTEQSISGWIREAVRQVRSFLEDPGTRACASPDATSPS